MPHNCLLTVADGHWRPLLPREDPSKMHLLMVEYSKSGRAKCRKCGESIPKGELRVGAPIKWRGGTHGWISSWQHLRCVRLEDPSSCDVDKHIYGLDSLTKSEQEEVRKEVLKTEVPEHLKPVDPEDPKFTAKKELKPAKQPKELKIEMLPYQKEGLGWMIEQESSPIKGGILADEMGMGKTLQMISLIVAQKPRGKLERKSNSGPTLIVCPTSAMMQWEEEIRSRTTENALSVFVFYAKRHLVDVDFLMQFDVVLTTYSVLEYEFRRILDQHKVACKYCGRKFLPRTLKSHNYYFCGPNAKRTAKQAKTEKRNPRKMTKKALKKAMKTLRIGTNVPTPSNIYREIMSQANRDPIPWFEKAPRSQEPREGKDGTEEENEEEEKENNDDRVDDDNEENDDDDDDDQEATGMKKSAPVTKRRGRSKGKNAKKRKIPSEDEDDEEKEEEEKEDVVKKPPPKKRRGRSATKGSLKDADKEVNEKKTGRANKRRGRPKKKIDSDGEEQGGNEVGGKSTKRVKKGRTSSSRKSQKSKKETKVTKKRRGSNKSTPRKKAAQSKSSQDDSFDAEDFVEDNKGMDEKTRRDAELAMSLQLMACEDDEEDYSPTAQAEILKSIEKRRRRSRNKKASTTPRSAKRVKRTKSSAPSGKKRSNASSSSSSSSKASPSVTRRSVRTTNSSRKKTPKTSVPTSDEDADEVAKGPVENTPTRRTKQASCDLKEGTLTDMPPLEEIFGSSSDDDQEQAGRQGKRNGGAGGSPAAADGIVKKEQRGGGAEKGEREEESPKPRKRAARRLRSLGGGLKKGQKKKQKQKELDEAENKEEEEPLSLPMPCPPSLLLRRSPRTSRGVVSYVDDSSENEDEAAGKAEKGERRDIDDEDKDPDFVVNEEEEEEEEDDDEEEGAEGQDDDDDDDGDDYEQEEEEKEEEEEDYTPPNTGKKAKRGSKAANSGTRKQSKETRKKRKNKKKKKRKNGKDVDDNEDDDDSDSGAESAGAGRGRRGKTKRRFKKNVKEGDIGWCHDEGISLGGSALHLVLWGRIILDEAHKIKARTNNTAKSVYALHSKTKWCVTGTPLQNRVGELYSLVRFLKMDKFSQYFCAKKGCECVSERWNFGRMQRSCTTCNHPPMSHYSYFNKMVINPIKRYGYTGDGRKALMTLKNEVLDRIMLRRTKQERAKDVKLPPLKVKVEKLSLDERERDFYDCIYRQSRSKFDTYVDKGTLLHNYAHIFDLLSRLRQAVDHPYLVIHGARAAPASGGSENSSSKSDGRGNKPAAIPTRSRGLADVCGICREDIKPKDVVGSACRHTFHRKCVHEYTQRKLKEDAGYLSCPVCYDAFTITIDFRKLKMRSGDDGKGDVEERACILCLERPMDALLMDCGHMYTCMECAKKIKGGAGGKKACPICRAPIKKIIRSAGGGKQIAIGRQNLMNRVKVEEFASSSKVDALMRHIREIREASNQHKAIIFSQYTGMLDIVEWRLNKLGLKTVKLSGSLSVKQRVSVLAAFRGDSSVAAILMSLKAGGEGLNLQEASHVFLLDPWWNPAVEMQAIQRAHRIGQTREVQAVRFITEDTIEDRMLELQQKKELVFSGTIDAKASSLTQLTEEDLRFLFQS